MFTRPQEPQSIGGVLDTGFRLFAAGVMAIVPLTYIGGVLGGVWNWYFSREIAAIQAGSIQDFSGFYGTMFIGLLVIMVIGTAVMAAAITRTGAIYRGEASSFGQAFGNGFRRWLAVFFAGILYMLALIGGTILLLVPGIYLSIAFAFCFYAATMDKKGPVESLGYSYRIVKGNWWRSTAVFSVMIVIAMVFYMGIGIVAALFVFGSDPQDLTQPSLLVDVIIVPILSAFITALFYCLAYALYEDLKLRIEGSDLESRIESLERA